MNLNFRIFEFSFRIINDSGLKNLVFKNVQTFLMKPLQVQSAALICLHCLKICMSLGLWGMESLVHTNIINLLNQLFPKLLKKDGDFWFDYVASDLYISDFHTHTHSSYSCQVVGCFSTNLSYPGCRVMGMKMVMINIWDCGLS